MSEDTARDDEVFAMVVEAVNVARARQVRRVKELRHLLLEAHPAHEKTVDRALSTWSARVAELGQA